ncbi:sensor histidine kinase [Cytobacillus kochii]|uniref:sensor histidine kinase n=1 Tax=Cytobacillus kochii TaxID=859143 RepID=UPI002E23F83E
MIEKVGIIVIVAFLLSQMKSFRQIIQKDHNYHEKILLILLFGCFGVISNYTGIEIYQNTINKAEWLIELDPESALANTRVMGIVIGALLGGPVVGIGAGIIAGVHRYTLGGFSALSCSLSTIVAGIIAGYLGYRRKKKGKNITTRYAVAIGMGMEALQMAIILFAAKPFEQAYNLVQIIGIPMIFINGFGTLLFMFIIQSIRREQLKVRVSQTNLAFQIADRTLPYFRQGLNDHSCEAVAKIMLKLTNADAVALTSRSHILSHVGAGSDHHKPRQKIGTHLTKNVLEQGEIAVVRSKEDISCFNHTCTLEAAIVLPLKVKNKIVGTLKMYYTFPESLDQVQEQLAEGLANLFSTQLELAEAEEQSKLLKDAEIKALQAQVHPHFLFNSFNTISVLCRTDANKARHLLIKLSEYFRGNIQGARQLYISLEKEIENVRAYTEIEQARFPNRCVVLLDLEEGLEKVMIPPFVLQPLVENAFNYGFPKRNIGGQIQIRIFSRRNQIHIQVEDNGVGIDQQKMKILGKMVVDSVKGNGTALFNICERLRGLYNNGAHFSIASKKGIGTRISISIPMNHEGGVDQNVNSLRSG